MWVHFNCDCEDWKKHFPKGVTFWCTLNYYCNFCGKRLDKKLLNDFT